MNHRLWFLRPLRDMAALKQRQDAVAFFTASRNDELASTLHDCIKHIKNIPVSYSQKDEGTIKIIT